MNQADWSSANLAHLGHCIAALQARLEHSRVVGDTAKARAARLGDRARRAAQDVIDATSPPPALDQLQERCGLSAFERETLLLCAAWELDRNSTRAALGKDAPDQVSFGLAMSNLAAPHWSATTPDAPLRGWGLVHVDASASVVGSSLRITEPILHFLKGVPILDPELRACSAAVPRSGAHSAGQQRAIERLRELWMDCDRFDRGAIQIVGEREDVTIAFAEVAADTWLGARVIRSEDLPTAREDLARLARGVGRDALLAVDATLLWTEPEDSPATRTALAWLIEHTDVPLFVGSRAPLETGAGLIARIEVEPTSNRERLATWQRHLGDHGDEAERALERLALQFDVAPVAVARICRSARARPGDQDLAAQLWDDCVRLTMPDLDDLTQRVTSFAGWSDLVLPPGLFDRLRGVLALVRQRARLELDWGFSPESAVNRGVTVLFAGPSGTGKTMAAGVLARELRLPLLRVDLSSVTSKWIGETEKNLRRIFDAAERGGAVLLFDEADALFGKRTEVKDSHDRHANVETSYLLQRLEQYGGLAILTTNHDENIDRAFLRRLHGVFRFPPPGPALRRELWRRALPGSAPAEPLDLDRLSEFALCGGHIAKVVREAAARAADADQPISNELLLTIARADWEELRRSSG